MNYKCPRGCGCDPMIGQKAGKCTVYYAYGRKWLGQREIWESGLTGCSGPLMISSRMRNRQCLSMTTKEMRARKWSRRRREASNLDPEGGTVDADLFYRLLRMPAYGRANEAQERFARLGRGDGFQAAG